MERHVGQASNHVVGAFGNHQQIRVGMECRACCFEGVLSATLTKERDVLVRTFRVISRVGNPPNYLEICAPPLDVRCALLNQNVPLIRTQREEFAQCPCCSNTVLSILLSIPLSHGRNGNQAARGSTHTSPLPNTRGIRSACLLPGTNLRIPAN